MKDDDQPSTLQKEWVRIARLTRERLVDRIQTMSTMPANELQYFVEALHDCMHFEQATSEFDHDAQLMADRITHGD